MNKEDDEKNQKLLIQKYYFEQTRKIPSEFYQQIVEKENEINISKSISEKQVEELSSLYKKAIELFSFVSNEKVQFFNNKLVNLLMKTKVFTPQKKKKPSKWTMYMKSHKKLVNQFKIFIELDNLKTKIDHLVDGFNNEVGKSIEAKQNDLALQREKFLIKKEKRKLKRKVSNNNIDFGLHTINTMNELVEENLNNFFRQFHFVFMHSKLFERPIEVLNDILAEFYYHKIKKYYYYQEQIKQFQLLLGDEQDGQHQESIQYYLDDLKKERELYFKKIQAMTLSIVELLTEKCTSIYIEDDLQLQKFKFEVLQNLIAIFS